MGSVKRLQSGKYRARSRDLEGRQVAKHFNKRAEADAWLASVESSKLDGSYVNGLNEELPIRQGLVRIKVLDTNLSNMGGGTEHTLS